MSFSLYDKAIVEKLREITKDNRIFIHPTENVFSNIAAVDKDNIQLPMISIMRTGVNILDNVPFALMKTGTLAKLNREDKYFTRVQAIPIQINYMLDVWTKERLSNDNIVRELLFYFYTHPTLQVDIPYTLNFKHDFNIFVSSNIDDNSDVTSHGTRGEYFRQTLNLYTNDAYLWKASRSNIMDIVLDFEVVAGDEILYEYKDGSLKELSGIDVNNNVGN